jgi:hypothetical protein
MTEPTQATLNKYGMSAALFRVMFLRQGGLCAICGKSSKRMCVDHEHVKGWKNFPPEKRVTYVRGLVCWFCNHYYLGRGITIERAQRVLEYLKDYQERKAK